MKIKIVEYFDKTTSKLNEIGSSRSNAATSCQSKQPSEDIEQMSIESFSCKIGEFLFNVDSSARKRDEKIMPIEIMQSSDLIFLCQTLSFPLHLFFFLFHSLYS